MKMLFCTQIQNKIGSLNWAHLFILWRRISARHHWEHWLFACVSWKCYPGFPILYFSIKILKLSNLREAITSKIIHYENCAENILFFIKRDISFREPCLYAELLLDYGFERNQDCCTGTTRGYKYNCSSLTQRSYTHNQDTTTSSKRRNYFQPWQSGKHTSIHINRFKYQMLYLVVYKILQTYE